MQDKTRQAWMPTYIPLTFFHCSWLKARLLEPFPSSLPPTIDVTTVEESSLLSFPHSLSLPFFPLSPPPTFPLPTSLPPTTDIVFSPGLKSTTSLRRVSSRSSMLSTLSGTTSFCSVTDATVATPEFGFEDRITFPVLPSNSMPVCVCVWGGGGGRGEGGKEERKRWIEGTRENELGMWREKTEDKAILCNTNQHTTTG